ncbi:MAG: ferritin [Pseudobutyrivibrio sp.]|nr:ferritin [Pseudobutyrivibrio sp.]
MDKKVVELLNAQVNKEFFSAYLYLGISKFFTQENLMGFASWYRVQAEEEQEHAMKIYNYLLEQDQDVTLDPINAVDIKLKDALDAAKEADKHERYITDSINKIMDAAVAAKDYRTQLFLNWFISEQEEEENNSKEMIAKIEMVGKDKKSLYLLDKEVGGRQG